MTRTLSDGLEDVSYRCVFHLLASASCPASTFWNTKINKSDQRKKKRKKDEKEDKRLGKGTPSVVCSLGFNEGLKVHLGTESVRLCSGVTQESSLVQLLCNLQSKPTTTDQKRSTKRSAEEKEKDTNIHDGLRGHLEFLGGEFLEGDGVEGTRLELAGGFGGDVDDTGERTLDTHLVQNEAADAIVETLAEPFELGFERSRVLVLCGRDTNAPELLRHKLLDLIVSVHDETQCGKLTRTVTEDDLAELWKAFLQSQRLETCENRTYPQIQFLSSVCRV